MERDDRRDMNPEFSRTYRGEMIVARFGVSISDSVWSPLPRRSFYRSMYEIVKIDPKRIIVGIQLP